jgi:hypothetical protein
MASLSAEQPRSPATGAGSARDRLRAGLLQRRDRQSSVSAEPPKPLVDVQQPAARQTQKQRIEQERMEQESESKRVPCAGPGWGEAGSAESADGYKGGGTLGTHAAPAAVVSV